MAAYIHKFDNKVRDEGKSNRVHVPTFSPGSLQLSTLVCVMWIHEFSYWNNAILVCCIGLQN